MRHFLACDPVIKLMPEQVDLALCWRNYSREKGSGEQRLPLVANIGDFCYQLMIGGKNVSAAIVIRAISVSDAMKASIEFAQPDSISFPEWVRIYAIAADNRIEFSWLPLSNIIKSDTKTYIRLLRSASAWPQKILTYLETHSMPWKVINLISLLHDTHQQYIADYIAKINPTVQQFKQFVETVTDFADKISAATYDEENFKLLTDRRLPAHKDVDELVDSLRLPLVNVRSADNFETTALNFSFTVNSSDEYYKVLQTLTERKSVAEKIYEILRQKRL